MSDKLAYSINEATALIGIGRSMLYSLIQRGELRIVHLGKRVLIPRAAILELLGTEDISEPEPSPEIRRPMPLECPEPSRSRASGAEVHRYRKEAVGIRRDRPAAG